MQLVNSTGLPTPSMSAAPAMREKAPPATWSFHARTVIDFTLALTMLILAAPVLLIAMALVKLTSRGPIFYSQTRLGRRGKPFSIYKLRSMRHESESLTGPCWSKPGDSRITTVGRWLRRTHIDELPQLWNVLCGEMSLIGPRPERPEFVPQLERAVPHYRKRLDLRPGLTGLAQVQLPPDTDLDSVKRKLAYDLYYVRHTSPWLDLRIHMATVLHMVGIPFGVIRKAFRFPSCEKIEHEYRAIGRANMNGSIPHANGVAAKNK